MANAKYEKISLIGQGPTAMVFDGRSRDLGLQVAIKELTPEWRSNARRRERVFQAAGRWAQVAHDNLVKYLDVDLGQSWIIMQRLDESAGAKIQRGPTDPAVVRATLQQMLEALRHVHLAGLLHANLKPNNVLYDQNGRAFLSDGLGVRRDTPGELPAPTTQKYLAPELISGETGVLGGGVDLYCLGFVLLEMLAGPSFEAHFQGIGADSLDSNTAWMRWHASAEKAPSARDVAPACPASLAIVIDRLLLKNPIERYQRADDALEDLLNPVHEQAAPGGATSPAQPTPTPPAAPSPAPSPEGRRPQPRPSLPPAAPGAPVAVRPRSAGEISPRPSTGVVLRIASGHRAGQMIGTNDDHFLIGDGEDCLVSFSREHYPQVADVRLRVRRDADGWTVRDEHDSGAWVNQQPIVGSAALRSGDVLRLSWEGPDVQFVMQSRGAPSITALMSEYLGGAAAPAAAPAGPAAAPTGPAGAAPAPPQAPSTSPSAAYAPAPPSAPAPPGPAPAPPGGPSATAGAQSARPGWLQFSQWEKKQQHRALMVGAAILFAAVLFFTPSKKSQDEPPRPDQPAAEEPAASGDGSSEAPAESSAGEDAAPSAP